MNISDYDLIYNNAAKLAKLASSSMRFRHGCVLIKGGQIVSYGFNKMSLFKDARKIEKILKVRMLYDGKASVHAEIDCFSRLNFNQKLVRGSTLVVYGESKAGNVVKSRPCPMCMKAANHLGVKKIIYSHTKRTQMVEEL